MRKNRQRQQIAKWFYFSRRGSNGREAWVISRLNREFNDGRRVGLLLPMNFVVGFIAENKPQISWILNFETERQLMKERCEKYYDVKYEAKANLSAGSNNVKKGTFAFRNGTWYSTIRKCAQKPIHPNADKFWIELPVGRLLPFFRSQYIFLHEISYTLLLLLFSNVRSAAAAAVPPIVVSIAAWGRLNLMFPSRFN